MRHLITKLGYKVLRRSKNPNYKLEMKLFALRYLYSSL